ncbi:NAD(P)H-dependent oxidoreductase [Robiginitalea sp. M366]|uniref:NAD(P)H-dependent oxidoreductase n=1 Tax=Robiginitalea aestuariiviva TaxID=3036903 RepID=UPI00240E2A36|nr:NAD(P)H-dependent oxidoreductase [Robiginitalea aestuariiviva]MDG1572809.1 NAD(P)H-dependent oxidoreductase [Robiginitalea aestuariiviva]
MKQTLDALKWRYAVKKFNPKGVLSEAQVTRLKEAFNLTATSYGLQPVRLLVLRDRGLQQQLVDHAYGQKQVADASHVLIFCIETRIDREYIDTYFERVREVRGTDPEILEPFRQNLVRDFGGKTPEAIRIWATHQAYLALGNLLTVCALEGIDACPMEGFQPQAFDRLLGLDQQGLTSVLALPVGFRAQDDPFAGMRKVRKDLGDSIIEHIVK